VASEVRPRHRPVPPVLRVSVVEDDPSTLLARFEFQAGVDADLTTGLDFLGGSMSQECWQVNSTVVAGQEDSVSWRQAGGLLFLSCLVADDGRVDPAPIAEHAYRRLLEVAERRGCPKLLRAWNFMPAINRGDGDDERYRRFCLGRAQALEAAGIGGPELCAGTAIGGDQPGLRIMILASSEAGINLENPRQVSAYDYPPIYGPRSPSFARATALHQSDGGVLLLISGTASVVGHETVHDGNLSGQLDEIVVNLNALLEESARCLGRPHLTQFGSDSLFRAYVRHAEHWPQVRDRLARAWPQSQVVGLRGDICRSDLLVEIEAVTSG
jgi:chorismate lyase / 3-hydroxybenzoate synthase